MLSVRYKSLLPASIILDKQKFYFKFYYNLHIIFKKTIIAYLLISSIMLLIMAADARPLPSNYSNRPSSSSSIHSFSMEEEDNSLITSTFAISQTVINQTSDSKVKNVLRYIVANDNLKPSSSLASPTTPLLLLSSRESNLLNNKTDELNDSTFKKTLNNKSSISSLSFLEQSRNAFLRLDSRPFVEPPLLPEEERRQIWLERHRKKKVGKLEQKILEDKKDLPGRKRILALTSADLINNNNSCKGDLFKHKIRMAGCEPKIIINRFCHGNCASFFIPKLRYKKLKATFQSCAACVPSEHDLIQVKLNCPGRDEKELYRTVMRVKKCTCRNIELDESEDVDDLGY